MQVFFEFLDFGVVGELGSDWAKLNVFWTNRSR